MNKTELQSCREAFEKHTLNEMGRLDVHEPRTPAQVLEIKPNGCYKDPLVNAAWQGYQAGAYQSHPQDAENFKENNFLQWERDTEKLFSILRLRIGIAGKKHSDKTSKENLNEIFEFFKVLEKYVLLLENKAPRPHEDCGELVKLLKEAHETLFELEEDYKYQANTYLGELSKRIELKLKGQK